MFRVWGLAQQHKLRHPPVLTVSLTHVCAQERERAARWLEHNVDIPPYSHQELQITGGPGDVDTT